MHGVEVITTFHSELIKAVGILKTNVVSSHGDNGLLLVLSPTAALIVVTITSSCTKFPVILYFPQERERERVR